MMIIAAVKLVISELADISPKFLADLVHVSYCLYYLDFALTLRDIFSAYFKEPVVIIHVLTVVLSDSGSEFEKLHHLVCLQKAPHENWGFISFRYELLNIY